MKHPFSEKGHKMKKLLYLTLSLFFFVSGFSQLPEFYKTVDSLHWVVQDLDEVTNGWKELGFPLAKNADHLSMQKVEYRGKAMDLSAKVATGVIGGYNVTWIQPGKGDNAYTDFLSEHKEGVISLNHKVSSTAEMEKEIQRLSGLGVGILQRGQITSSENTQTYVYFDTAKEGKYVLGLVHDSKNLAVSSEKLPVPLKKSQFAFVVKDLGPVSAYWSRLGFPEMQVTHGVLTDLEHRGQPGQFDQKLGWQRHGEIVYEWILPLKGPTVYNESLEIHGEGFHHMAFDVEDMDEAIEYFGSKGIPCSQSGGWGEKGKPGSGRFAYVDTEAHGGLTVELLWNYSE